jgi:hypothetical protein
MKEIQQPVGCEGYEQRCDEDHQEPKQQQPEWLFWWFRVALPYFI